MFQSIRANLLRLQLHCFAVALLTQMMESHLHCRAWLIILLLNSCSSYYLRTPVCWLISKSKYLPLLRFMTLKCASLLSLLMDHLVRSYISLDYPLCSVSARVPRNNSVSCKPAHSWHTFSKRLICLESTWSEFPDAPINEENHHTKVWDGMPPIVLCFCNILQHFLTVNISLLNTVYFHQYDS